MAEQYSYVTQGNQILSNGKNGGRNSLSPRLFLLHVFSSLTDFKPILPPEVYLTSFYKYRPQSIDAT